MMNKIKRINVNVLFAVILVIQVVFMLFYCNMKTGFFVDEIWSYGLANSYYHAQIWEDKALDEPEIEGEMFSDYLTVNEGEEFAYGSVIYNQTHDAHPPLFYMALHTVSSFFPGEFNKWFGLSLNVIYFFVTIIFLYLVSGLFSKNKLFAIFPVLMYGFSLAAIDSVTYVRMYMLLTMWSVMFAYCHLKIFRQREMKIRDMILLAITTFGGICSQYFFAIFAFPWVALYMLMFLVSKNWKVMWKYVVSGAAGLGVMCVVYPTFLKSILGQEGGHSQTTFIKLHNLGEWWSDLMQYHRIVGKEMFGSILTFLLILLIVAVVVHVIFSVLFTTNFVKNENQDVSIEIEKNENRKAFALHIGIHQQRVMILAGCIGFYYMIVAKISPWINSRYIMCIYPLIAILMSAFLYWVLTLWIRKVNVRNVTAVVCIFIVLGLTFFAGDPSYTYPGKAGNTAISKKYADVTCSYIYSEPTMQYIMVNNALELENYSTLYQMQASDITKEMPNIEITNNKMVVYLDKVLLGVGEKSIGMMNINARDCFEQIEDTTGLTKNKQIYEDDKVAVYLFYK